MVYEKSQNDPQAQEATDPSQAPQGETNELATNNSAEIDEIQDENTLKKSPNKVYKMGFTMLIVTLIVLIVIDNFTTKFFQQGVRVFFKWMEEHPLPGIFSFVAIYFLATVLFFPSSLLNLGSGFVFVRNFGFGPGILIATVSIFIAACASAFVAFLLSRYLFREWALGLTKKYPTFKAVDAALQTKGVWIVCLLRLSPLPFTALNYICGASSLRLSAYLWSMISILPETFFQVFFGASAGSLAGSGDSGSDNKYRVLSIIIGFTFAFLSIATISFYSKKELKKIVEKQEGEGIDVESYGETLEERDEHFRDSCA